MEGKDRDSYQGKHVNDQNHGKSGYVGGNPRYRDSKKPPYKKNTPENSRNAAKQIDEE